MYMSCWLVYEKYTVQHIVLTACNLSVSSLLLLRHLAAAILFLSLLSLLFSSSSGDS